MRSQSPSTSLTWYGLLLAVVLCVTPWIGAESVSPRSAWDHLHGIQSADGLIFWLQRLPRVTLSMLAGGGLAMVGAAFQVLFRNPLVEPFTLGVSGGAALGAFLTIAFPALSITFGPFSSVQIFALAGATLTLGLIYNLSRGRMGASVYTLLLAGITMSIICGGGILLVTYLANPHEMVSFQRWLMGGVDVVGFKGIVATLPFLTPGIALLLIHARDLNHLALGDEIALGHGVDVPRVQRDVFLGGGLATAAIVSLVGPIGFVGLIVPHVVRIFSGYDQRLVLPGAFLVGAMALTVCDTVARTAVRSTELPVGIITALIGGPLFIKLLVSAQKR